MTGILSLQFEPVIDDKKANLQKVAALIDANKNKKLDLIVLPEFFLTGVGPDYTQAHEEENGGEPLKFLSELAKKYNSNIACGSIVRKVNGKLFNTLFVLNRIGEIVAKYDKTHLYKYFGGTEDKNITAGNELVVADLDFGKLGLSVCFDIRYPMQYRKLVQMGAEIIASPTAWAYLTANKEKEETVTRKTFEALNITRAFENLVYFVTSNQCGSVGDMCTFIGGSMITSPMGEVIQNALEDECGIYADVDLETVRELKKTYPAAEID